MKDVITENSFDAFEYAIRSNGVYIARGLVDSPELLSRLRSDVDQALSGARADSQTGDAQYRFTDIIHNLFLKGESFLELVEHSKLNAFADRRLGPTCILHSYNGVSLQKQRTNNASKVHRDSPRFYTQDHPLLFQALVCLDPFTQETGATRFLLGSHHCPDRPPESHFKTHAIQIQAEPGDVVFFDSLVWHAGGENSTDRPRRGITLVYSKSFMKQQIDYPRAVPARVIERLGPTGRRLLGMDTRVPASMDEFLLPEEQRLYKANQG
jgi:ectoine hydroxylase-related dioxygenase (phytanoyl-CoA dioxygenase family)